MPAPTPPSQPSTAAVVVWWSQLGFGTERHSRRVLTLATLGFVSGVAEAAVVVLVISLASGAEIPLLEVDPPSTALLTALALVSVIALAAAHVLSAHATARFGSEAERALRRMLIEQYLRAPWSAQQGMPPGQLQDLVLRTVAIVANGTQQAAMAASIALNFAVLVVAAVLVSPWTTLVLATAVGVVVAVSLPLRAHTRRSAKATIPAMSALAADVTEKAGLARDLRVFGVTEGAVGRLHERVDRTAALHQAMRRVALAIPRLTRDVSIAIFIVGISLVVASSAVSLTTLGITAVLVFRALAHAQGIAAVSQSLVERRANLDLLQERLREWQPASGGGDRPCPDITRLRLAGVGHAYASGSADAVDAIDLTIERGEMIGLVGPSGAGKTTIASILIGLVEPTRGSVEVSGVPLAEIDRAEWHRRTAWVAQEPQLLTGTIADNVRFLRPGIDDERVRAALRVAGLQAEVDAWPEGIHQPVGPAGTALSGGERQRVALARAVAGGPEVIVLDEPTSALDAHTEAAVRHALDELREAAVVVVVAHRLSTIRACDRVAVLEDGRIAAIGPPADLVRSNLWFQRALELSAT